MPEGTDAKKSAGAKGANSMRDHALSWEIPPPLPSHGLETALKDCSNMFLEEGMTHLASLLQQQLSNFDVSEPATWTSVITNLAQQAVALISPPLMAAQGDVDPRKYIKVKRIPDGSPSDSTILAGIVLRKNVAHKRMRTAIENPRVVALADGLEYHHSPDKLSSLDTVLDKGKDHVHAAVDRLLTLKPDVVLVERSVSRAAQDLLLEAKVTVVSNVRLELLRRIALSGGGQVANSIDNLSIGSVGTYESFHVDTAAAPALHHDQVDETGGSVSPNSTIMPLMTFDRGARPLGCTILLYGGTAIQLKLLKSVMQQAVYAAYWNRLEASFLPSELLAAAATMRASDEDPIIFDACSSVVLASAGTSKFDREDGAIKWASPHMSDSRNSKISKEYGESKEVFSKHHHKRTVSSASSQQANGDERTPSSHQPKDSCSRPSTPFSMDDSDSEESAGQEDVQDINNGTAEEQLWLSISCKNPAKGTLCEPAHAHCMPFYKDQDLPLAGFIAAAAPISKKCPQCGDGASLHLRSFLHGNSLVTLSSIRLPAGKEISDSDKGTVWIWLRPLKKDAEASKRARRIALSPDAACISFSHVLALLLNARHMVIDGANIQTDFVRYIGFGSVVLCLHYSSIQPYSVNMPPVNVAIGESLELSWIANEIKELKEEANEAFDAIDSVLTDYIKDLELPHHAAEAWVDNLSATRKLYLNKVNDAVQMVQSIAALEDELTWTDASCRVIWHGNQLRKLLGWIVLQWASSMSAGFTAGQTTPPLLDTQQAVEKKTSNGGGGAPFEKQHPEGGVQGNRNDSPIRYHSRNSSGSGITQLPSKLQQQQIPLGRKVVETTYAPSLMDAPLANSPRDGQPPLQGADNNDQCIPTGLVARRLAMVETNSPSTSGLHSYKLQDSELSDKGGSVGPRQSPTVFNSSLARPSLTIDLSQYLRPSVNILSPEKRPAGAIEEEQEEIDFEQLAEQLGQLSRSVSQRETQDTELEQAVEHRDAPGGANDNHVVSKPTTTVQESPVEEEVTKHKDNHPPSQGRLAHLLSQLLTVSGRKQHPLHGKVDLSGRCLFPSDTDQPSITVYDDEITSIVGYFLSTREYADYIASATSTVLHKDGEGEATASELNEPNTPDESTTSSRILRSSMQLDCQMTAEDSASPVGSFDVARFQTTAYYAPQFSELRKRVVTGGEEAFLASISRCQPWLSKGGKSNVYFAKTRDDRYIVKQLSRSERQSFLEFAPDYLRYLDNILREGRPTCLAKILGVYQVSVQHSNRSAPFGRDGVMDIIIMENIFYNRSVTRIYDLKGSERDRYATEASVGLPGTVVLFDDNLREANQTQPTLIAAQAFQRLQSALWEDTGFLAGLGVMDYSLLVGFDRENQQLVVGLIDYIRQYTWDKQVETWVKKTGILGGAGKDPTVISPRQYCKRFRAAISSYLTPVPDSVCSRITPLDPDSQ